MKNKNYLRQAVVLIAFGFTVLGAQSKPKDMLPHRPPGHMKTWTKAQFESYIRAMENNRRRGKTMAHEDRKSGLHDGNKIRTLFYNYGSIGRPNTEPSLEWPAYSNHGYAYEFGPIIGAEVVDADSQTVQIFSDGMLDGGDYDPSGGSNWWGWEPLPGYANPAQNNVAVSNDPNTWGDNFPVDADGYLQWPGQYGEGKIIADFESYYVMDDQWNKEFQYYPYPSDSSKRGLGIEVTVRGYQYAASVAEDIIFFQYEVKNVSEKRLEKVVVGMIGDPHIGGAGDFSDDYAGFIDNNGFGNLDVNGNLELDPATGEPAIVDIRNMVYCWDKVGSSNDFNIMWDELGWLGYKFLESPGIANDGIDNDNDGFIDESQYNGIDDDGDWQATDEAALADTAEARDWWSPIMWNGIDDDGDGRIDDWGDLDGKSDDLNGNGVPDPGEPDFELADVDESDMIGLTSFWAPQYGSEEAGMDDIMWRRMVPGTFATPDTIKQDADNIFIFGSGYFSLDPGETQKFSIAVIMGQGKEDLFLNAKVAEWIYKLGFQFTKPPEKPEVVAVPGDRKVTLYWNDIAEESVDPVNGKDFEGYRIYRSNVKGEWGDVITNNTGNVVANVPIAQFDLIDEFEGPHAVASSEGYHMDMGDNTGLTRVFVDSNLVNGLTYYYAVTAYDKGSVEGNLPPLECSKNIGDVNVVTVTPNAPAAGYTPAQLQSEHYEGIATATLEFSLLDPINTDPNKIIDVSIEPRGAGKYVTVSEITGTDTTVLWDEISLNVVKNDWGNRLQFSGYNMFILDLATATFDSAKWLGDMEYFGFTVSISSWQGAILYPRDMVIEFADTFIDTSVFVNPQPVKFKVTNIDDNQQIDIIFNDNDGNNELSVGDVITPLVYRNGMPTATWDITIDSSIAFTTPPAGSQIRLYVSKPFCTEGSIDRYRVSFTPATVDESKLESEMGRIAVVPNPYVASSGFETPPPQVFTYGRGERRVDFIHLPPKCTIRIYTMAGEHVKTLEHSGPVYDGTESWNLLSKDNHEIAPGIYIYHIETPGGKEKIGRLAVIK
ncbi:MAG: hypothetical protein GXO92_04555 [FCB group bacterium]|nr:hypothetical protein [FCB group bacterium]